MTTVDPNQIVRLRLTDEVSHFCGADGQWCDVELDAAGRYIMIKAGLAHEMLSTGLPSSFPLRDANASLVSALGPWKPQPSINLRAHEEAWRKATTPPSKSEVAAETLRMYAGER